MHVIIVGAGLSGLLIAQGLKKNGIPFSIFEKSSGPRSRNWAVTMHWAREDLARMVPEGLVNRLIEGQVDRSQDDAAMSGFEEIGIRNGATGDWMFKFPFPGVREYNMSRTKTLLSEGLDVRYQKAFSHAEYPDSTSVTAVFEDGTKETGTVLIGCDGGGSRVRRAIMESKTSADPEPLPFRMVNLSVSYSAEQAQYIRSNLHPLVDITIHPKGMYLRVNVLDIPDHEKPETWVFQILATWPRSAEGNEISGSAGRLERLRELVHDYTEPHRSAVQWLARDFDLHDDQLRDWEPRPWNNRGGKLTMAGDAAHAMTFHLGQGANNAVKDAAAFVDAMKQVKDGHMLAEDAVAGYEAEMKERGLRAVRDSRQQALDTHAWETISTIAKEHLGAKTNLVKVV